MSINLGLEAVNYNVDSKFSKELIEIFQDVINLRKQLKEKQLSMREGVTAITKHFLQVSAPQLTKCIQKHTGIPVSKLYLSKAFSMMFACTVDFGGDKGINMYTTIQQYSGLELSEMEKEYFQSLKIKQFTNEELAKLTEAFDVRTGKMNITKLAGANISFILYFDYNSAFLAKETGHMNCEYMTAEEIAAITLHEVGHMLTMFEHAADTYFKAVFYNNNIMNFLNTSKSKYDIIMFGLSYLEKQFPSQKNAIDALRTKTDEYKELAKGSTNAAMPVFVSMLYVAIVTLLTLMLCSIMLPLRLFGSILKPITFNIEDNKKLSDYAALKKQCKYCEQLADEFVSRHGLSGPLGSGLQKIFTWCSITGIGTINKNSSLAWNAAKIPFIICTMFYGDLTDGGGSYDREYDRTHRAMVNLIGAFKDSDLPLEAIKFYTDDYERCKEVLQSYKKSRKLTEVMQAINNFVRYLLETPLDSIFTGRFLREYDKLHDKAEYLTTNSMFYHASKLKQIAAKLRKVKE